MIFGTHQSLPRTELIEVKYNGIAVEHVTRFKYLGIVLDPRLSYTRHVDHIRSKTFSKIKVLSRVRNIVDLPTGIMLYKTLILPIFYYNDYVYDAVSDRDSYGLQKLQNCSQRILTRSDRYTSVHAMHRQLEMPWLDERHKTNTAKYMDKCVYKLALR